MKCENGSESILSSGPWAQLIKVRGCICDDGKARTVRITGQPDTFFSIRGSVKVRGVTVTGFVTQAAEYRGELAGYVFHASKVGKNYALLAQKDGVS